MKALLSGIHSPDVHDFDNIVEISVGDAFCVLIQAFFRPENEEGEDAFSFLFCNASYLAAKAKNDGFVLGRSMIIVDQLSRQIIEQSLTSIAEDIEGDDWQDVANKLNRYGQWEFEDYQPFNPDDQSL